jgi:hypothetical protein
MVHERVHGWVHQRVQCSIHPDGDWVPGFATVWRIRRRQRRRTDHDWKTIARLAGYQPKLEPTSCVTRSVSYLSRGS